MKMFKLNDEMTISVEKGNRGIADDYKVVTYLNGKQIGPVEYYDRGCLEWEFDIKLV